MNSIEPVLISISGGVYVMGSAGVREDESPPHEVEIGAFSIGKYPVTNLEYGRYMVATGVEPPPAWNDERFNHPDQPVVTVSWFDAADYCEWLSRTVGMQYRLPTEAERETACRGGTTSAYPWGDDPKRDLGSYGKRWQSGSPERVGGAPNRWGLCNMADNVHEWCLDWYRADYYASSPRSNPGGPLTGIRRSSRGGSWRHQVKVTRSSARSALDPAFRYTDYGFRVVRVANSPWGFP